MLPARIQPDRMMQRAEIRFAKPDDVEQICRLMASPLVPAQFWRRMIAYSWLAAEEKPDLGAVIAAGTEIVGYLGAMYSNRVVAGRQERFCNVFGWYVKPEYRHYSVSLLSFLVRRPGLTFFNVTPADHVLPIFKRIGFTLADEFRYVCKPGVGALVGSRSKVRVVREEDVNEDLLGSLQFQIFQDHFGHTIRRFVFTAADEVCLIFTKRMYWSQVRFPRTEFYYASNPEFFARHFQSILPALLRRDKTVALHIDQRQLGFRPKRAQTISAVAMYPSAMLARSETVPMSDIDRLYSELVILP
jgi:acetoacetyl-CoA synthetase